MDQLKHFFDGISTLAAFATLLGWIANVLPPLAALASILWMAFQFYHSIPMKEWRAKRREKRSAQ